MLLLAAAAGWVLSFVCCARWGYCCFTLVWVGGLQRAASPIITVLRWHARSANLDEQFIDWTRNIILSSCLCLVLTRSISDSSVSKLVRGASNSIISTTSSSSSSGSIPVQQQCQVQQHADPTCQALKVSGSHTANTYHTPALSCPCSGKYPSLYSFFGLFFRQLFCYVTELIVL